MANMQREGSGRAAANQTFVKASGTGTDGDPWIPQVAVVSGAGSGAAVIASAATLTNVSSSASNGTLLASNADRIGVLVQNDSTATLYLKYGATATTSSYTVKMEPGSYWEMPQPVYTGIIDGIWSAANGAARITELE